MPSLPPLMQCMEVWGGNEPVESAVGVSGLDAWVYSRPFVGDPAAAACGGDVHYVSSCATGRIVRLLLADVSGHGPAVSTIAAQLRSLMRQHVNHMDQAAFVGEVNRRFTELSEDGCFATAIVNTFFAPTRRLTLCNAGHPSPLLYRRRDNSWTHLRLKEMERGDNSGRVRNLPLGIEGLTDYEQFSLRLDVGDVVVCYSDSLIEAHTQAISPAGTVTSPPCDDLSGETAANPSMPHPPAPAQSTSDQREPAIAMLGERGLLAVVREIDLDPIETFVSRLLRRIGSLSPGNLLEDDVTVLLFRSNGGGVRVSHRNRLLAPLRVLAGLAKSIIAGERPPLPEITRANLGGAMLDRMSASGDDADQ